MTRTSRLPTLLAGLATAAVVAGCNTGMEADFGAQPAPPAMSDPNVASVVSTVNQGAIDIARVAANTAADAEVRRYAERLIEEHRNAGQRLQDLLRREGIQPATVALTRDVQEWNRTSLDRFRQYETGEAFDREFIEHEIATHRWVIQTLEGTLIPSTRDREFRAALVQLVGHMREHLNEAQRLQRTL